MSYFFIRYKITKEYGHTSMVKKLVEASTFQDAVEIIRKHEEQIRWSDDRKELSDFEDLTLRTIHE